MLGCYTSLKEWCIYLVNQNITFLVSYYTFLSGVFQYAQIKKNHFNLFLLGMVFCYKCPLAILTPVFVFLQVKLEPVYVDVLIT